MKLIDEKGRLFGLINVIDLFVLTMIVCLIGFGGYKMLRVNPRIATENKDAVIKLLITDVRDVTVNAIAEGETTRDFDKNTLLGTIVKKEVKNTTKQVTTSDGRIVEAEVPGKFDVMFHIEGKATISNNTILMGNQDIRVGKQLGIKGLKYAVRGTVMDISINE